jgi:hypothetical protein
LSRRSIDYAKDRGELPYLRKGRKILFKITDLEIWMEADRVDVSADLDRMAKSGTIPAAPRRCRRGLQTSGPGR